MKSRATFLFIYFILSILTNAQTLSNLSVVNKLVELSAARIDSSFGNADKKIKLIFVAVPSMQILKSGLINNLINHGFNIETAENSSNIGSLSYAIESVSVVYSDVRKTGFFGDLVVDRTVSLNGEYFISDGRKITKSDKFHFAEKDTVKYDSIQQLENAELAFTKGKIPEEPLFSNLLEPIIVAGTLIITVILFFTVRSR